MERDPVCGMMVPAEDTPQVVWGDCHYRFCSSFCLALYGKLRHVIAPLFFQHDAGWLSVMRQTIAINAAHFHTHRMVQQYGVLAYV